MKIAYIVDSSASISQALKDRENVYVVDLSVAWEGASYNDTNDESLMKEFYHELDAAKILPTTSQPDPAQIIEVMNDIVAKGYEDVIAIILSSAVSGTFNTVDMIAREFSDSVTTHVIDSKGTSYVIENQLKTGLSLLEQGYDVEEIVEHLQWLSEVSSIHVVIRRLDNLVKGGRLNSAVAFLGSRVKIFPLLKFDDSGAIVVVDKVRTLKKVYKYYLSLVQEGLERFPEGVDIAIAHGDCQEDAYALKDFIEKHYPGLSYRIGYLTPVLGAHGGLGALGMGILPKIENMKK